MKLRKLIITLILVIAIPSAIPTFAAEKDDIDDTEIIIYYEDIENLVLENNLQLKSNKYSLEDMEDALDDLEEARDEIRDMQREIWNISGSIGSPNGAEPNSLENATKASLNAAGGSLGMNMPSTSDFRDQIQLAELNFVYAQKQLVSGTEELFVMYHQIKDNLVQLESNSQTLTNQIEKAKLSYEYGYALSSTVDNLEYKLEELNKNHNSLLQQKDLLLLQFKNLIGVSSSDNIELGNMSELNREYVLGIDYESDLEEAIENSMTIEILKKELRNADASGKKINNDVKIRKNEIDIELTNQYQLLLQLNDNLLLAENNLNLLENELFKGYIQFNAGNITKINLDSLENQVNNQKSLIKINESNLFNEMKMYKNMKAGMI